MSGLGMFWYLSVNARLELSLADAKDSSGREIVIGRRGAIQGPPIILHEKLLTF
jgi:hypothetical protein